MGLGSSPAGVTYTSYYALALNKGFLDIQATIECGFSLKHVPDMIRTSDKYSEHSSVIRSVQPNG